MSSHRLYATTVLGSPCFWGAPYQDHTPEQLAALRDLGYEGIFVNIAWSRPWLDVVTLEEMTVAPSFPWLCEPAETCRAHRAEMRRRVDAIVAAGLDPYFIFGSPRALKVSDLPEDIRTYVRDEMRGSSKSRISGEDEVACIQSEAVRALYAELLRAHLAAFPETAGFLFYTVDELAEVCDEADDCPRCHGVPLEERLPGYLAHLRQVIDSVDPTIEMYWEPWEFTAAQSYAMVERLPERVDLTVHSCLHEVYFVNQPDLWFHHLMLLAEANGVRVMVNLFLSGTGEDLGPVAALPCPRLVWQQLRALWRYPAVRGFKEYYGTTVEHLNVNDWALRAALRQPDADWQAIAAQLADRYAPLPEKALLDAWEQAALALEVFPWDLGWRLRQYNSYRYDQHPGAEAYWDIAFEATLPTPWTTPSWESSRRSFYVSSDFHTPRLMAETEQRLSRCVSHLETAIEKLAAVQQSTPQLAAHLARELEQQLVSLRLFGFLARSRRLHLQTTRLAKKIRDGEVDLVSALRRRLGEDVANARALLATVKNTPWQALDVEALEQTLDEMET